MTRSIGVAGRGILAVVAAIAAVTLAGASLSSADNDTVRPNDNRRPAGRLKHDTLRLNLVVQPALWRPQADSGPTLRVEAFGELGKAPEIPAPLIRVSSGTVVHATVRNDLPDSTVVVHGLVTRPATSDDSLVIAPGKSAETAFLAGAPGTYLYFATVGAVDTLLEREQLAGALVIDAAGAPVNDRVFVINIWGDEVDSVTYRKALTINGRSFPWTETIRVTQGDSVRWRWINASARQHPMHLHGFYFRVDAKGDGLSDSLYPQGARRLAVTEDMRPRTTLGVAWSPDRPGNWLFHCHLMFHVLPDAQLDPPPAGSHAYHSGDMRQHMAGLVLGIAVKPRPDWREPAAAAPRRVRLFVQEGKPRGRAARALSFIPQRNAAAPAPDSVEIPGGPLVLTRGEPTEVTVVNRLTEGTAVHWHGLELESYSDGVPGWSGAATNTAPVIAPGDSFVARLTLARAGTFIYHTHLNDFEQLTSGLYGAIVVLEPGQQFDPATDHLFVSGWDGQDDPPWTPVNGDSLSPPLPLRSGVVHRLRFVNIGMAGRVRFTLRRDTTVMNWRALARDGADLPAALATAGKATASLTVGQTADFAFDPPGPGTFELSMTGPGGRLQWRQTLVVE